MDPEEARIALTRALEADGPAAARIGAARDVLLQHGTQVFDLAPNLALKLEDVVRAADQRSGEACRSFAVLLVLAVAFPGVVPLRGDAGALIRRFLERALLNPLRRAGYRFDASPYDKNQALARLHATIDEHLRPLEPSIPRWIHGVGPNRDE
jgi:hypothetical protein